jgi:multiple antibiotic resistance protein
MVIFVGAYDGDLVMWQDIVTAAASLFVIVDPFGVVPVYLTLTEKMPRAAVDAARLKATVIAAIILGAFVVGGNSLFRFFGISLPALQIGGGILLLLVGISQLQASGDRIRKEEEDDLQTRDDVAVFPLATPLLAGPGAISSILLISGENSGWLSRLSLLIGVLAVLLATYFILKWAAGVRRVLGQTGLNVMTRVMGILLTAIAVQFVIDGCRALGLVPQ